MPAFPRHPGPHRLRGVVVCTSAVVLAVVLAGCASDEVTIESRNLSAAGTSTCRDLLRDLPDELAGEPRRPVDPNSALGAAWGDPALVLECGTTMPDSFDEFSPCSTSDDVQWFIPDAGLEDPSADITIWSLGYEPVIQLLVPSAYRPEADAVMGDLGTAIIDNLELVHPCV